MATAQTNLMTANELMEWADRPENRGKRYELDRGVPVEMPPAGELHGVICMLIARLLGNYVFERGRGIVCCNDTGLLVEEDPDTLRGPDVMLFDEKIRREDLSPKYSERIPKLIVEVLSPSDSVLATDTRVEQYHGRGVPLVWVVDPVLEKVSVRPQGKPITVRAGTDDLSDEEVLPGFRCGVADLFALPEDTDTTEVTNN